MNAPLHHELAEENQSLWLLVAAPSLWALHFLASYVAGAIYCGAPSRGGEIGALRLVILAAGVVAALGIGLTARVGWRMYKFDGSPPPFDRDTPEDRHRFLGVATLLLSALSLVATSYTCLGVLFVPSCL